MEKCFSRLRFLAVYVLICIGFKCKQFQQVILQCSNDILCIDLSLITWMDDLVKWNFLKAKQLLKMFIRAIKSCDFYEYDKRKSQHFGFYITLSSYCEWTRCAITPTYTSYYIDCCTFVHSWQIQQLPHFYLFSLFNEASLKANRHWQQLIS